jgi:predicted nuclease of predicted toxin-antitoxin system
LKLLADENIDRPVVEKLRARDVDVLYIDEVGKGVSDEEVVEMARDRNLVIVTFDRDFSDAGAENGVIRLTSPEVYDAVVDAIIDIVESVSEEEMKDTVIEVSPSHYR